MAIQRLARRIERGQRPDQRFQFAFDKVEEKVGATFFRMATCRAWCSVAGCQTLAARANGIVMAPSAAAAPSRRRRDEKLIRRKGQSCASVQMRVILVVAHDVFRQARGASGFPGGPVNRTPAASAAAGNRLIRSPFAFPAMAYGSPCSIIDTASISAGQ
jgi:hypothetical protein